MNLSIDGRLKSAIRVTFAGGSLGAALLPMGAIAQDTGNTQLQGITITGSLIRRVDKETSNPVVTVTRKAIEESGVTSVGQLLEQLPQLSGDALTPQINNGGAGDSAATISLRGLGPERTLTLLDGKRVVNGFDGGVDVNLIPINMIERIEVVNEGVSTVYGSDAVAGVVNIITRKNFKGTEVESSFGAATQHGDAQKFEASFTTGSGGPNGRFVAGISYDREGSIQAGNRPLVGGNELLVAYNTVTAIASSRIPSGLFALAGNYNATKAGDTFLDAQGNQCGGESITLIPGAQGVGFGATTAQVQANFECRKSLPKNQQTFNFQVDNFIFTPANRIHLFATGDSNLSENVKLYYTGVFANVKAKNQLAPEAFDSPTLLNGNAQPINPVISAYSQYNPFGTNITAFKFRATDTGLRHTDVDKNFYHGTVGLKINILDRFDWDNSFTYSREDTASIANGFLNIGQIGLTTGPSQNNNCYASASGPFNAGATYSGQIAGCTPVNYISKIGTSYGATSQAANFIDNDDVAQASSTISGELFTIPHAGSPISTAVGVEWRQYHLTSNPDSNAAEFNLTEDNSKKTEGAYSTAEAYAEFLIPLLHELPGAYSLKFDGGIRYSYYSNFKNKANGKVALEYKPIKDLLLRATYADIFRAPTITNLYAAPANSAPTYKDPCNGYTGQNTASQPFLTAACVGVPTNGTFTQADSQGSTVIQGNPGLHSETGYTMDFGFIYDSSFYRPLTLNADLWRYTIHGAIEGVGLQTALNACVTSGNPVFCGSGALPTYIRNPTSGQVVGGFSVPNNIGDLTTSGLDAGISLNYPKTPFGSFLFSLQGTYLDKYVTSINGLSYYSEAGSVDQQLGQGGFPRVKFNSTLVWDLQNIEVVLRNRFVGSEKDDGGTDGAGNYLGIDLAASVLGTGGCNGGGTVTGPGGAQILCTRETGYRDYQDLQVTYKVKRLGTDLSVGVNDVFDQQAPLQYTFVDFNYDPSNYDVTGRFVYGRVSVHFK